MTPREIADLFADLELQLIASLARNLAKHKAWEKDEGFSWPAWQAQKLNALNRYRRENKRQMQEFKSAVTPEIETLLQEQFKEADGSSEAFLGINADKVNALIEEINHTQVNVQKASLRFLDDVYRKTILKADAAFAAGGVTMQQATDRAVRDFLSAGINSIEYRNGRRVNIATYAEMALRTSSARAMLFGEAQKRARLGIDTVLVSQYGACSNTCLPWQGIVYIDDVWGEYTGESNGSYGISRNGHQYPLLSVAVRGGLFHPNCRHTLTTWIEGISTRPIPMDKAKIERVNRLERRQRTLETQVRKWKRLREGTGTPEEKAAYDRKVQAAQKKLRELIAQHGDVLRRDVWRERDDKTIQPESKKNPDANDYAQYERYVSRMGKYFEPQGFTAFQKIKRKNAAPWMKLQEDYRYTGIIDRLLQNNRGSTVCNTPADIPSEYSDAAKSLTKQQQNGLYHYSHYSEGVRMNKALGNAPDIELSIGEQANLRNTANALHQMSLPQDTILWRGTDPKLLQGFDKLDPKDLHSWKHKTLGMNGFASTSILRTTSYSEKPVQMVIFAPKDIRGAGYIDTVSYNASHLGKLENGYTLVREHEVLLQKNARYTILEAQKFNGKIILVVRWLGSD